MKAEERELSMDKATAVNTCLGVLKGRDCIYLDKVKRDGLNNLTFTGDINGHLISQHRDEKDWGPYTLWSDTLKPHTQGDIIKHRKGAADGTKIHGRI